MEEIKESIAMDSEGTQENHCAEALIKAGVENEAEKAQIKTIHAPSTLPAEKETNLLSENGSDQSFEILDNKSGNKITEITNSSKSSEVIDPSLQFDNLIENCNHLKSVTSENAVGDIEVNKSLIAENNLNILKPDNSDIETNAVQDLVSECVKNSQEIVSEINANNDDLLEKSVEKLPNDKKCDESNDRTLLDNSNNGNSNNDESNLRKNEKEQKNTLNIHEKPNNISESILADDKVISVLDGNDSNNLLLGNETSMQSEIKFFGSDSKEENRNFDSKEEEKIMSPKNKDLNFSIEQEKKNDVIEENNKSMSPISETHQINIDIDEENLKIEEEEVGNLESETGDKLELIKNEENKLSSETNSNLNTALEPLYLRINTDKTVEAKTMETTSISKSTDNFSEIENKKELVIKSDSCLEENSNSNINTSGISTEQDGENLCKSDNDSSAVIENDVANCQEIEMIDLSENEIQKEKDIDGMEIDLINLKDSQKVEHTMTDVLEIDSGERVSELSACSENQKDAIPLSVKMCSDNSEEETITGDAERNIDGDKDEDICIIPDDRTPKLSVGVIEKSKQDSQTKSDCLNLETPDSKISNDAFTPELDKSKIDKKREDNDISKSRPLRSAAKLAGNKIRSLVLNEVAADEAGPSNRNKEDRDVNTEESHRMCAQCKEVKLWKFLMVHGNINQYLCSEQCSEAFAKTCQTDADNSIEEAHMDVHFRKCAQCHAKVSLDEKCLFWETMNYCNDDCLGKYQMKLGSVCANCKGNVFSTSLGKYCVRFGCDIKQFCCATCLEEYKKGLKVCSYCQKDMSTGVEGFLAPVGDKGQFKDFCTQACMEKYEQMSCNTQKPEVNEECAVCSNYKPVRVEVDLDNKTHKLCSEPCFAAFKFVNNVTEGQCNMCKKYFDRIKVRNHSIFYDDSVRLFCCNTCMNVYILAHRKIIPCNWCKVKKYNFDMIRKGTSPGQVVNMCSLNCLKLHQLSTNKVNTILVKCDFCTTQAPAQYHLTMSDTSIRNFCSHRCVVSFQSQYPKQGGDLLPGSREQTSPVPTGLPRKAISRRSQESSCVPVISSVQSLASSGSQSPAQFPIERTEAAPQESSLSQSLTVSNSAAAMPAPPPQIYQQIITKPPPPKRMKNKSTLCKPYSHTKGVSCRPHPCVKETQTDQSLSRKFLIPIPVPIYVPCPMHMFATPFPVPVPFPLPVPVPIFIPTTRNSAKGIMKEIKKIQEKIPTDPFEAELLMMAEMVAGEKKQDPTDSESEEGNDGEDGGDGTFSPDNVDASNTFGDDMLQMALKMASELEEPAVDMESVLTSNTITTQTQPPDPNKALYNQVSAMPVNRGRKRSVRGSRNSTSGTPNKRGRRTSGSVDVPLLPPPEPVPPPRIEVEKPDADMCLKYTFGVNAWRHWVMQKNAELEKVAMTNRKIKLFKPELLQLTADELNFSLCLFVKEVRKPNGTEYAPDTIYYLCLGIQQYLFENGRIDNIFTDSYYEKFTDCLDEVAKKFAALYNDSQYIVTRVEEEHLWESKQLGAHSPHVLLSTLMFFNTKHFNLVTVEEHMQLSFSHIMKHWKRNPNTPGIAKVPGSRNVLLRFYPPQSALEANSRKKKVYEQQENEENPLRCPVKLYEFYLSKCPESVKTRNDVFYLLPERSCVPDSPVWYSTMALGKEPLMKMLHRVKMVKEINIALLSC